MPPAKSGRKLFELELLDLPRLQTDPLGIVLVGVIVISVKGKIPPFKGVAAFASVRIINRIDRIVAVADTLAGRLGDVIHITGNPFLVVLRAQIQIAVHTHIDPDLLAVDILGDLAVGGITVLIRVRAAGPVIDLTLRYFLPLMDMRRRA